MFSDKKQSPSQNRNIIVDNGPNLEIPNTINIDTPIRTFDEKNVYENKTEVSKWKNNQLKTGSSPYNSYFGKGIYNKSYENRMTIHNGQNSDVIVCLTQKYSPYKTIRNEYIRAGESFEMTSIPNGTYYIKSFFGNDWNPNKIFIDKVNCLIVSIK